MAWSKERTQRAVEIANWFIAGGQKRTYRQILKKSGLSHRTQVYRLVRDIRDVLRTSPYTLTCAPNGSKKPWLYWITAVREEDSISRKIAIGDLLRRFKTRLNMNESFRLATKGNTREGKVIRAFGAHLESAIAELELVD